MKLAVSDNCYFSTIVKNEKQYIDVCNSLDLLIFGSDQIWNPNWFHPFYYADYQQITTPRVAYAPSIGVTKIMSEKVEKYEKALERFAKISVREESGVEVIQRITKQECIKVVDPTLLLAASEWDEIFNTKSTDDDYVLLYLLNDNKNHIQAAIEYAKKIGIKLKIIPYKNDTYLCNGEVIADAGPKEFLELIKNAHMVITDSFHGMIFSIIYRKQFYILTRFDDKKQDSQNSRIYQIIDEYGLHDRLQEYNACEILESRRIDYQKINRKINEQIEISLHYLREILKEIEENE